MPAPWLPLDGIRVADFSMIGPAAHTREILVELRFDDGEIADMAKAGAVRIG